MVVADNVSVNTLASKMSVETVSKPETTKRKISESELSADDDAASATDFDTTDEENEPAESTINPVDGDNPAKKPRLDGADLYRPPTHDELNQLRETESLYQNSLFRLQITEMLTEISIKKKKTKAMESFYQAIKTILLGLEPGKEQKLSDMSWLEKLGIKFPLRPQLDVLEGTVQFFPPRQIKLIGSYPLHVCLKPKPVIDIAVEMPSRFLESGDYKYMQYFHKRAVYLATLAHYLRKSKLVQEVCFSYQNGNVIRPILVIQPADDVGHGFRAHIHLYPGKSKFGLMPLHLDRSNIKPKDDIKMKTGQEASDNVGSDLPATPRYNMWMLRDIVYRQNQDFLEQLLADSKNIQNGIALLKVWLHQRELDQGIGAFSGYIMTMCVAYLLMKHKLNSQMSSYQVMRNTLLYLSEADWTTNGVSLYVDIVKPGNNRIPPTVDQFHQHFDVVFVDRSGFLNLCADVCAATWERLKHEAILAQKHLSSKAIDGFDMLFMTPIPFIEKFDYCFTVTIPKSWRDRDHKKASLSVQQKNMDACGNVHYRFISTVTRILKKALDSRIRLLDCRMSPLPQWGTSDAPVEMSEKVTFGLLIDPENAYNILIKGPSADDKEAAEKFRSFWGEKSELRRFQDSSVCEAVLWPSENLAEQRTISFRIIKYILKRHLNLKRMELNASPLDVLLQRADLDQKQGTGEERIQDVHRSFDSLAKTLRNLKNLPLKIHTVQSISPVLRYAEVFSQLPHQGVNYGGKELMPADAPIFFRPPFIKPISVICMLASSAKWPGDKDAVQRVKAAFLLKIYNELQMRHSVTCMLTTSYIDIHMNGFVFRVEIGYKREIGALKKTTTPDGVVKSLETSESQELTRKLILLPKLTSTMLGLQQQRNSSFSCTVRLAKRWLSAHFLLGDYIAEEAVELIVASLYLSPAPLAEPGSPQVGFLRFLRLLSTHDWHRTPLIVNLNGDLTDETYTEINKHFAENRVSLPLMFIATPFDMKNSQLTKELPTMQILQRVVLLARESLNQLHGQLLAGDLDTDFRVVFRPPLDVYDVIIHLNTKRLPRYPEAVDILPLSNIKKYEEIKPSNDRIFPLVDFNPVELYLRDLRESFGQYALFFNDIHGGDVVAVVWKIPAFKPNDFKASNVNGCQVSTSNDKTVISPNVPAMLKHFEILGNGLVKKIESRTEQWSI